MRGVIVQFKPSFHVATRLGIALSYFILYKMLDFWGFILQPPFDTEYRWLYLGAHVNSILCPASHIWGTNWNLPKNENGTIQCDGYPCCQHDSLRKKKLQVRNYPIRLAYGPAHGASFKLLIDGGGSSPLRVVPSLGGWSQVAQGSCLSRNQKLWLLSLVCCLNSLPNSPQWWPVIWKCKPGKLCCLPSCFWLMF